MTQILTIPKQGLRIFAQIGVLQRSSLFYTIHYNVVMNGF